MIDVGTLESGRLAALSESRIVNMNWVLVVFLTSPIGEPPPRVIFQAQMASKDLCEVAASEVKKALADTDTTELTAVSTVCLQTSN